MSRYAAGPVEVVLQLMTSGPTTAAMAIPYWETHNFGFLTMSGAETLLALLALALSAMAFYFSIRRENRVDTRDNRIEKSTAYLSLELASIDVFRYKADHFEALNWAETGQNQTNKSVGRLEEEADQFFYQCLNLFEVCSRFRSNEVIEAPVYASWVAWFFETLEYEFFRRKWVSEYRDNYTAEIRKIFDFGVGPAMDWQAGDVNALRDIFYAKVADICGCDQIRRWRVPIGELSYSSSETSASLATRRQIRTDQRALPLTYRWNEAADIAEAAAFGGRVISASDGYISHGEIQTGLSPDGKHWTPNLAALYAEDFANPEGRDIMVGRDADGDVRAIMIIAWEETPRLRYAVVEDMAVDPELRSSGIGSELMALAEARVRSRGVTWMFLESGLRNERAHDFFERHGFHVQSKVFAKHLQ